jgi:hypothetical protein
MKFASAIATSVRFAWARSSPMHAAVVGTVAAVTAALGNPVALALATSPTTALPFKRGGADSPAICSGRAYRCEEGKDKFE